jgi:AcrR family transcriptional regulator
VSEDRSARERILDAAEESLRIRGIRATTMVLVARAAGVGRSGLYWHYPDKAALISAALIRRDAEFWSEAHDRVRRRRGLAAKVAEAVAISRTSPWGPLAMELRDREPEQFAEIVGSYVYDVIPGTVDFWHQHLAEARLNGEVRQDLDIPAAAEWVLRQVISLAAVPGEAVDIDDTDSVKAFLTAFLLPALI